MNTRERRQFVLEALKSRKIVQVEEVARELGVSTMTIRRDFNRLAEAGAVTLIRGGAVWNEGAATILSMKGRATQMTREKNSIAAYCANLVKEGNAIYLDSGTTTMKIAEALRSRQNIAVLTHSLSIQNILATAEKIQLIAMPGIYDESMKAFFGDMTCRFIRSFRIDLTFLGITAIDIDNGVMTADFRDQALKKALIERSRKNVAVLDNSKIGDVSFAQICPINAIQTIVTDKMADEKFIQAARKRGVEVIQV